MTTWRKAGAGLAVAAMACATALANHAVANADDPNTNIVGGGEVTEQVPWISALHSNGSFTCTSALVAKHWVLTASHCVDGGGEFSVRIGSLQRSSGGEEAKVSEVIKHPGYDWPNSDIALLRLDHDVDAPVVQTAEADDLKDGQAAKVLGWGSENPDWSGPLPENLKFATGTADIDCDAANPAPICTQTDGSVAGGDSGGPVLVKSAKTGEWAHAGVCAIGHQPAGDGWAGYTDISKHQQWYDETIAS